MTNPTSTTELAVAIIYDTAGKRTLINTLTLVPTFPSTPTYDEDEEEDVEDEYKDSDPASTKFLVFIPGDDSCHTPYEHIIEIESYTSVDMVFAQYKVLAIIHLGTVYMECRMVETKLLASRGTQPVWDVVDESVHEQRERLDRWAVDVAFEHFDVAVDYDNEDEKDIDGVEDPKKAAHARVETIRTRMELRVLEVDDGDIASLEPAVYTLDDC